MSVALEGDQLRLVDGSLWVVKGCHHPLDGVVAVPRIFEGRKLKRLHEAREIISRYYRHYERFLPEFGRAVPVVPHNAILEYLTALTAFEKIVKGSSRLYDVALELAELLSECGLKCGLSGSLLGGYHTATSDIDLVCVETGLSSYDCLKSLRELGLIKNITAAEAVEESAAVGELLPGVMHEELLMNKLTQGTFKEVKYTLRVVDCSSEEGVLGPYHHTRREHMVVKLLNTTYKTPAVYDVELLRPHLHEGLKAYLLTYRARLTELPSGTVIKADGLLHLDLERRFVLVSLDDPESVIESLTTCRPLNRA
ncbi:MAG: hypothetical protein QW116_00400 [Zestosphaera sp.]